MEIIEARPSATREQWGMLATRGNFNLTGEAEFDGDAMHDDKRMALYAPLTPSPDGIGRHPGPVANLWWDASDHGMIRSVAHAVAIVRADIIRTEYADPRPMEAIERRNFDEYYGDPRTVVTHVLDWAYMFEWPGFDASPREHRVSAAWHYIIHNAEDFHDREDFLDSIGKGLYR